MFRIAILIIVSMTCSQELSAQEFSFKFLDKAAPAQAERISELEAKFTNGNQDDFHDAAIELMVIASELSKGVHSGEGLRIARNIFLSSAPAKARRAAYSILERLDPNELAKHTTVIQMKGPHCTCWGRFQDALNQRLLGNNPWILKARASNTRINQNPQAMGTIASLEFAIGNQHDHSHLIIALKEAGFDIKSWKLMIEVPAESVLDGTPKNPRR